ncbi:hypothetical protein AKO1_005158, partial [Acrasis kona]
VTMVNRRVSYHDDPDDSRGFKKPMKKPACNLFYQCLCVLMILTTYLLYEWFKLIIPWGAQLPEPSQTIPKLYRSSQNIALESISKDIMLCVSILTISRGGETYLKDTLVTLFESVVTSHSTLISQVIVYHPRTTASHTVFDEQRSAFKGKKFPIKFIERDNLNKTLIGMPPSEGKFKWRMMSSPDKQQNLDVVGMLLTTYDDFCTANDNNKFVMLMEDDFVLCPHAIHHLNRIVYAVDREYFSKRWSVIRTSVGLNGIIVRCQHLPIIAREVQQNYTMYPADSLLSEVWTMHHQRSEEYFGKGATFVTYRHNIMRHIGVSSTIHNGRSNDRVFPGCYDPLTSSLDWNEAFQLEGCEGKEFTPCDHVNMGSSIIQSVNGNPEHDANYVMSDAPARDIKIVSGYADEDCNSACSRHSSTCARYMFPVINRCDVMKLYFDCKVCAPHEFFYPPEQHRSPVYKQWQDVCWTSNIYDEMKCEGSYGAGIRLCPCEIKASSSTYKLIPFEVSFHNLVVLLFGFFSGLCLMLISTSGLYEFFC